MALPRHQKLRQKASLAMRSGDFATALRVYGDLERLEPDDPTWPERLASAHHALGRTDEELVCLRRSLSLLVDQGQVLPAIATCKLILDVAPDDPETLDRLHWLYAEPSMQAHAAAGEPPRTPSRGARPLRVPDDPRAPLVELELTDVVPLDDVEVDLVDAVHASFDPRPARVVRSAAPPAAPTRVSPRRASASTAPTTGAGEGARLSRDELARTPLFGSLDASTLQRLVTQVSVVRLDAGEVLFREGDPADTLYLVVDGAVVPIAEGPPRTRMAVLERGAFFGEIGLVTNQPRTATIEALVDTRLLAIDRRLMWSLIREGDGVATVLLRFVRERLIDRTLRTHPLLAPLAAAELADLPEQFRFLELKDGAPILEQGQASGGLFVLLAGTLDVVDERTDRELGPLAPGAAFGVRSLVRDEPAAASVFASGKCWVLVLEAARLRRLIAGRPSLEDALLAATAADDRPASVV